MVHREAVRIAAEQAALRTSVSAMFLNLARRSQTLVDRMIGELDEIERGEEDPKRLAQLFELDHLATRMRRNDENLLVLAGADSTAPRRDDALLVDALRAAQSEVELYNRIEFGTVDTDISIAAHAVNDVVRLVAELLDNATRFSPPNTMVVADGRRIRDYVVIQVEDRGLGLTEEQMDSLNRRLADPPSVDVAAFRLMGLAVVSRLASRYGIRVELRAQRRGRHRRPGDAAQPPPWCCPATAGRRSVAHAGRVSRWPSSRRRSRPVGHASRSPVPADLGGHAARPVADQRPGTRPVAVPATPGTPRPAVTGGRPRRPRPRCRAGRAPGRPGHPPPAPGGSRRTRPAPVASLGSPTVAFPTIDPLPRRASEPRHRRPARRPPRPAGRTGAGAGRGRRRRRRRRRPPPPGRSRRPGAAGRGADLPADGGGLVPVARRRRDRDLRPAQVRRAAGPPRRAAAPRAAGRSRLPQPAAGRAAADPHPGSTGHGAAPAGRAAPPAAGRPAPTPAAAGRTVPQPPAPARARPEAWRTAADEGWPRASQAAEPTDAGTTRSGLPKRVPQAQLVPGGVTESGRDRSRRTPDEVRGLLSAYHRGVQRGRTAGSGPRTAAPDQGDEPMNRPATMQDMGWLLTNFADSVAGIAHVVAVSADGLLLASSRDLPADRADQLAAITSGVVSLTEGASRMFSAGAVLQTVIEMDSGYLFLMSISDGSSMAVLAARSCDVGQVGYEMALLVERVGAALVPLPRDAVRLPRR